MVQLQSERYNIAWFKLAEFVARKEKERALSVFKLLAHSLQDDGLALQLEGDLLLSFSDEKAILAYHKAAQIYESQRKYIQAISIYDRLLLLGTSPTLTRECLSTRVRLYYQLGYMREFLAAVNRYVNILREENLLVLLPDLFQTHSGDPVFLERIVHEALSILPMQEVFELVLHRIVEHKKNDMRAMQSFLASIALVSPEAHAYISQLYAEHL